MRIFPSLILGLAVLLVASACGKSTTDPQIVGKWKLVEYGYGGPAIPIAPEVGLQILTLRNDHVYMAKYKDSVAFSGIYRVSHKGNPPKSILYFSDQQDNGTWYTLTKDTLVLTYAGITTTMYAPQVSKYVKM